MSSSALHLRFQRVSKGAGVTRIERLNLHPALKEQLLSELKRKLGCGGAVKDGVLEFQGDHRDKLEGELVARGHVVKRVGG